MRVALERSSTASQVTSLAGVAVLATLDLTARLVVPAAVLALARGMGDVAVGAAASVTAVAVIRGLVSGRVMEWSTRRQWNAIVGAVRRYDMVKLSGHSEDRAVIQLLNAAFRLAAQRATVVPRLVADSLGLVIVSVGVLLLLSPVWLLLGLAVLVVGGLALPVGRRRLRDAEVRSFDTLAEVGRDLRALLAAPAELRAHDREQTFSEQMLQQVDAMAADQRRANTYSALVGLLPFCVAVLVAVVPLREHLAALSGTSDQQSLVEITLLGGAALLFSVGLVRGVEAIVRATPHRRAMSAFLAAARHGRADEVSEPTQPGGAVPQWGDDLELLEVSVVYPGADMATPLRATHVCQAGRGLAIVGDNGSGKSTLAQVILGLISPSTEQLRLGGTLLADRDRSALSQKVVYLPQDPYVDTGRSVRWHLQLLASDRIDDPQLHGALRAVGLEPVLEQHAARGKIGPLDVTVGELSGGEQQRLFLARLFIPALAAEAALFVLDEPEAGLDQAGRDLLMRRLERLGERARVVLLVHDRETIPEGYDVLRCERGLPE